MTHGEVIRKEMDLTNAYAEAINVLYDAEEAYCDAKENVIQAKVNFVKARDAMLEFRAEHREELNP
jgi:hypothetical protein